MGKWLFPLLLWSATACSQTVNCTAGCTIITDAFPLGVPQPENCELFDGSNLIATAPVVVSGSGVACKFSPTFAEGRAVSLTAKAQAIGIVDSPPSNILNFVSTAATTPLVPSPTNLHLAWIPNQTMTVAVESGFPKTAQGVPVASVTTPSFSTAGASLIVALVGGDSAAAMNPGVMSSTAGLTWSLAIRKAWTGGSFVNKGMVEIWTAPSSGAISSKTVTWTPASGSAGTAIAIDLYSITGASSTIGATGGKEDGTGSSSTIDATVNATAAGSMILGIVFSGADGAGLTARSDTTFTLTFADGGTGTDVYAGKANSLTSGAGNVTIGATNSKAFYATAAVEILDASGGSSGLSYLGFGGGGGSGGGIGASYVGSAQ